MHVHPLPRALGRYAPLAAAILGSAALAGPASAQVPVPPAAAHPPEISLTYNTGEILAIETGTGAGDPVEVRRGGALLATGSFDGDSTEGFAVNSQHLVDAGVTSGCWETFTPQILPGDVVTAAGTSMTIPDIWAADPVIEGDSIVVHGTAGPGVDFGLMSVQIHPVNAGRFSGGVGSSGGQFLDSGVARGFSATLTRDAGSAQNWTARFSGLGSQIGVAQGGSAVVLTDSTGGVDPAAGEVIQLVGYESGATAQPAGGCNAPYAPNEARSTSRALINVANAGSDLTVTGVSQPGASMTGVTLIDSAGKTVAAGASGAGAWTATVPASSLSGLADGAIRVASTFSIGAGRTVGGLLSKDTTAPNAPRASVTPGTYPSTQNVGLSASEGTIRYTTDGSEPTASSRAYSSPISVDRSQAIKAVTVDGAGNVSSIAEFGYAIVAPALAPPPLVANAPSLAKLKVESLSLTKRMSTRSARRRGMTLLVYAPEGAKIARIRVLRGTKVVQSINRKVSRDGVLETHIPSTKKARRALKRGTYRIEVRVGQNLTNLGAARIRTIKLV
jgi:hypothetical protein